MFGSPPKFVRGILVTELPRQNPERLPQYPAAESNTRKGGAFRTADAACPFVQLMPPGPLRGGRSAAQYP
jgi:hypothetical protein